MDTSTRRSLRLDSWKEIAAYLKRGARTVQRWEREEGLPVHRLPHEKLGSVYAYSAELDAWWSSRAAELSDDQRAAGPAPSIAVLPFADMSQNGDQAYFCDGIAEEIISALSRIAGLRVASRTSSFRVRPPAGDSREIGRRLGVQTLLEGSVRKSGDHLRISVQLIDAVNGFHLWSERYDRQLIDIFPIQDEIAQNVVQALEITLSPAENCALRKPATHDIQAYDCYLRGRKFYYEYSPRAMEFALQMFRRAIELDANYAQAYAGLADCWSYTYLYSDRSDAVRAQADGASLKAVELDPGSAQALASRGLSLSLSGRNEEANRAFEAAIRIAPDLFEARYFYARHAFALGQLELAVTQYEGAMRARPEDYQSPLLVAQSYDDLGRHADAAASRKQGVSLAERHLLLNPDDARAQYMAANGLAALGERERSRRFLDRALAIQPDDPMLRYNAGCIFAMLELPEPALDCLEKAARGGLTQRGWYLHDSNLDPLRSLPRFQELLVIMGLPSPPVTLDLAASSRRFEATTRLPSSCPGRHTALRKCWPPYRVNRRVPCAVFDCGRLSVAGARRIICTVEFDRLSKRRRWNSWSTVTVYQPAGRIWSPATNVKGISIRIETCALAGTTHRRAAAPSAKNIVFPEIELFMVSSFPAFSPSTTKTTLREE